LLGSPPYDAPLAQLVDARTLGEYAAGRVPTATFAPWGDNLSGGLLRPRAELEDLYAGFGFDPERTTITYCLVGWRASVAWLTLTWLGFADARVYDGSWLEWGAGGFPIETD
jgi:thiosulfate/3-mercaptopyruvate sulfurtransferase